jgi:hypothetical protein
MRRTVACMAAATITFTVPAIAPAAPEPLTGPPCTGLTCSFEVPPGEYELRLALGSRTRAAGTGKVVAARRTVRSRR